MQAEYLRLILTYNAACLVTLGSIGWDGHPDHISTHRAAEQAKKLAEQKLNRTIGLLALNAAGDGSIVYAGDPADKLAAMQYHRSQHHILPTAEGLRPEPVFWSNFRAYHPLVERETYDVL